MIVGSPPLQMCMTLRHRDQINGTDIVASEQKNGRERHGRGTRSQVKSSLDLSRRFNPVEHPCAGYLAHLFEKLVVF